MVPVVWFPKVPEFEGLKASAVEQDWLTNSQFSAERELREHVVFHVQNDYAREQAEHLGVRKRVAD
jgi:hypothetical protein